MEVAWGYRGAHVEAFDFEREADATMQRMINVDLSSMPCVPSFPCLNAVKVVSLASTQPAYAFALRPLLVAADRPLSGLRYRLWVDSLQRHQRHCREHDVPGATRSPCQDDDRPPGLRAEIIGSKNHVFHLGPRLLRESGRLRLAQQHRDCGP